MESDGHPYAPPKYVMLSHNHGSLRPPPYRRNVPRYPSKRSSRSCCFKFLCCCYCFLLFFTLLLLFLTYLFYTKYKPQIPSYNVDSFSVKAFNMQPDMSLFTEFAVAVKAENPNEHIGFTYGEDSEITISYTGSNLCYGKLPAFHQPRKNTTIINISLAGTSPFGSGLQAALMENRHTGRIPLLVSVHAPVNVVLGDLKLRRLDVYVNCSLVIDNLSPNKKVRILSTKYDYSVGVV
ncbi:NDR1/HIN1-like protein 6 [Corylus avellana]|uniref:NDR1/HIN1-like protein 6 n=1 Tax=Corylus avellana TaxID=13451 RepID=UPI001E217796|nr:NDR1/HIN1-like protein 6 [Corylus avellana]